MSRLPIALPLLALFLLPSCASLPAPLQMIMLPAEQVRHGGGDVADSYYRLGRQHQQRGDLTLALTAYTYAIARNPQGADARIAAAVIHAQQGRLPQARAMLQAVCDEYPDLVQPRNNLGYVRYLQGDYAEAAAAFRGVLAIEPNNQRARNNLLLAQGAGHRHAAGSPALAPPLPAVAAAPTAPVAAAAEGGMRLVQHAPNRYELQLVPGMAPAQAQSPVPAEATPPRAPRLEIANANGAPGMAKRVRQALAARGIAAVRLTNARPFGRAGTSIEFRPGFEQQARALQAAMGGAAALSPSAALKAHADLRLVLGRDALPALDRDGAAPPGRLLVSAAAAQIKH
ncbi:LytR C-terminal domain-containing protein [Massilia soli]|uniref:Tetratricopeptide repeat protein n=1 Tax=Massilia soli TaxID=2792854 RepID=A0ABS7SRI3_9BURK|nr:LytR C-terminal domain-containing protein [Massilia soli]MBZ2208558.1 tetratricopeptide repeat protein [Massilia soli]